MMSLKIPLIIDKATGALVPANNMHVPEKVYIISIYEKYSTEERPVFYITAKQREEK